ncbi:MAG TPA: Na+/H+ antiporter subunit E [Ramlibacter sp.]|uniref:Na+/H+ antiporter subunit E n=1 Tax=Ramlibacter sp. TaxID=1917967 RepID=UPI002D7FB6D6|nr:Na+/H+ antiporter subunit E [Ramlibacter sp.]HET8746965.1 Na+/H+ antiporter subunit E [Ramlibacter sp.]
MKRWLPSPLVSASLWAMWLLLNDSLALVHLLTGAVLGVAVPLLLAPLLPPLGPVRRPWTVARLILRVGADVVLSGLQVAQAVWRVPRRPPRGAFVAVPLQLREPHALAALAIIVTVIPGTVWCELASDRSALLLHVFDLDDEAAFIEDLKVRYEQPLREIFE